MFSLPSKTQLQSYFFDGAWSLGIASLITGGIISPLTLILSGGLFAMQAAGNFPVTRALSKVRDMVEDFMDPDFKPSQEPEEKFYRYKRVDRNDHGEDPAILERLRSTSKDHDFKYDFTLKPHDPINDPNAPIRENTRAQLFETQVKSYLPARGIRRIPGMTWLLGEQRVRYTMPTLNPVEINAMEYAKTRSGLVNFKTGERKTPLPPLDTSNDKVRRLSL